MALRFGTGSCFTQNLVSKPVHCKCNASPFSLNVGKQTTVPKRLRSVRRSCEVRPELHTCTDSSILGSGPSYPLILWIHMVDRLDLFEYTDPVQTRHCPDPVAATTDIENRFRWREIKDRRVGWRYYEIFSPNFHF